MFYFTGIDVSKDKIDIGWLRDANTGKKKSKVLKNTEQGHAQAINWLLKNTKSKPNEIVIVLEPTGIYHEALMYALHDNGFNVLLVNPGKAKQTCHPSVPLAGIQWL